LGACESDTTSTPVSPGEVTLRISALWPRAGEVWWPRYDADDDSAYPGDPEPVLVGCDRRLGVSVALDNFSLRVPDACGTSPQCGFLSIELDPDLSQPSSVIERAPTHVRGTSQTLTLDLSALEPVEGVHQIHTTLLTSSAREFTGPFTTEPVDLSVSLAFEDCAVAGSAGSAGSAGMDGMGGAGGESGASSDAGASGSNP
jgi:hypothetical protein